MAWALRLLPLPAFLLLALAVPHRVNRSERYGLVGDAAVKAISTIHTAETRYYSQYGRYAISVTELGPAQLIDRYLASGRQGGFKFTIQPTQTGYAVSAAPLQFGTSGTHTYFSDQSMSIHQHKGEDAATAADPLIGETIKG